MQSLTDLAQKYNTDKKTINSASYSSYLEVYEPLFAPFRDKVTNILEIGVHNGESLRLWRDYFRKAQVFGLDINPNTFFEEERIQVFIGDQGSKEDLDEIPGSFDIVCDDGSHVNELTIKSFKYLWPRIEPGGLYIIEDLGNSYSGDMSFIFGHWPGMEYNRESNYHNNRESMNEFFNKEISRLDLLKSTIKKIEFWPRLAIFHKL